MTRSLPSGCAITQHLIHKEDQRAADCGFLQWEEFLQLSVTAAIMRVVYIYVKEERRMDLIDLFLSLAPQFKLEEFLNCFSSVKSFLK